jgi:tetratricopeptide (TPR) repeat protein
MIYKKLARDVIIIFLAVCVLATIFMLIRINVISKRKQSVIATGLSQGQNKYFQKQLASALKVSSFIDDGNRLLNQGNYNGAIESYKQALSSSRMDGEKGMSMEYIADAYEKKRDYRTAQEWMIKVRDSCPEWSKKPDIERAKYLDYASKGDYELAVGHAENALKEYQAIDDVQIDIYTNRLNDLKAAESYIRSLKKQQQ